jgi:Cdc6-like AAA superfamily ATPase
MLSSSYRRQVWLVYGQTGAGKTVLARALLQKRLQELGPTATGLIVDTLQEHVDVPAINPRALGNYLKMEDRIDHSGGLPRLMRCGRVLIDTDDDFTEFEDELEPGVRNERGPIVLMIDEVSYWSSPNKSTPGLSRLIRYGRHWQVDIIGVVRAPAETSTELRRQATMLYIAGHVVEPRDRTYFSQNLPEGATAKLDSLPEFHYIRYDTRGVYVVCPPVKISSPRQF